MASVRGQDEEVISFTGVDGSLDLLNHNLDINHFFIVHVTAIFSAAFDLP